MEHARRWAKIAYVDSGEVKPFVVTIPNDDLYQRLQSQEAHWDGRIKMIPWAMHEPLPKEIAEQVDMVVIGHYWEGKSDWTLLKELPNLKIVQLPSAGFEHALPHIPQGVVLCNGRGVHSAETAELAVGLVIAMQRGIAAARDDQQKHEWNFAHYQSLADRRVLIVGNGSVGQAVAKRLAPFEVELTYVNRDGGVNPDGTVIHPTKDLKQLAGNAEIMILTVPLNDETYHLINDEILQALPDDALVVNVARGRVVDQQALLKHLYSGRIRAALDVTTPEPLPKDDPLWDAPNVLITPHQGGNTDATYPRFGALVKRQLNHIINHQPLENIVNEADLNNSATVWTSEYS